jgi:hypothetical protein
VWIAVPKYAYGFFFGGVDAGGLGTTFALSSPDFLPVVLGPPAPFVSITGLRSFWFHFLPIKIPSLNFDKFCLLAIISFYQNKSLCQVIPVNFYTKF